MSASTAGCELTPAALADLDSVWRYVAERWSPEQADRYIDELTEVFDLLASMPAMARERTEFKPPVRIHVHGSTLVVYIIRNGTVVIVRILGGQQDWRALLENLDM